MLQKPSPQALIQVLNQDNQTLTGFADLDELTSCFTEGSLVFLASRPSMGKTSFALNMAANVLFGEPKFTYEDSSSTRKLRRAVAYFSLQLPKEQVVQRISAMLGRVPIHDLGSANGMTDNRVQLVRSVAEVSRAPLFVTDPVSISLIEMKAALVSAQRRLAATGADLGLVVLDYFQLMRLPGEGKGWTREYQTRKLLRELKLLAQSLNVWILVLAQLGPALEQRHDKRPCFRDFKMSEPVEEYADTVIFLYRDELYDPHSYDAGITEVIVAKDRHGPAGMVKLAFLQKQGRYASVLPPLHAPEKVNCRQATHH